MEHCADGGGLARRGLNVWGQPHHRYKMPTGVSFGANGEYSCGALGGKVDPHQYRSTEKELLLVTLTGSAAYDAVLRLFKQILSAISHTLSSSFKKRLSKVMQWRKTISR